MNSYTVRLSGMVVEYLLKIMEWLIRRKVLVWHAGIGDRYPRIYMYHLVLYGGSSSSSSSSSTNNGIDENILSCCSCRTYTVKFGCVVVLMTFGVQNDFQKIIMFFFFFLMGFYSLRNIVRSSAHVRETCKIVEKFKTFENVSWTQNVVKSHYGKSERAMTTVTAFACKSVYYYYYYFFKHADITRARW